MKHWKKLIPAFVAALFFALTVMSGGVASAATLNVVGGQLVGAFGVDVGGTLYDVEFVDGTCFDLFNGCDSVVDFTFGIQSDALDASQALLDQVILDTPDGSFDSIPSLTNGCEIHVCAIYTPYAALPEPGPYAVVTYNEQFINVDGTSAWLFDFDAFRDFTSDPSDTFARWSASPIPEPSTALLLGIGLAGLGMRRRRGCC